MVPQQPRIANIRNGLSGFNERRPIPSLGAGRKSFKFASLVHRTHLKNGQHKAHKHNKRSGTGPDRSNNRGPGYGSGIFQAKTSQLFLAIREG